MKNKIFTLVDELITTRKEADSKEFLESIEELVMTAIKKWFEDNPRLPEQNEFILLDISNAKHVDTFGDVVCTMIRNNFGLYSELKEKNKVRIYPFQGPLTRTI